MATNKSDYFPLGMIIGVFIMAIVTFFALESLDSKWRKAAVEHGAAEWVMKGTPPDVEFVFKWKDEL